MHPRAIGRNEKNCENSWLPRLKFVNSKTIALEKARKSKRRLTAPTI